MQMNSRNNGNRARGQRIMTTIKMNTRDAAKWRIKLIITHLYGTMELLSRGISVPGPDSEIFLHSPQSVDIEQWRMQWRSVSDAQDACSSLAASCPMVHVSRAMENDPSP